MGTLIGENLSYSYSQAGQASLKEVSIELLPGTLTALVGPNGAGKSTLLRLLQGQIEPNTGHVTIDGDDLIKNRNKVALMPQRSVMNWSFPITVEGLVSLGRSNHSQLTCCDLAAVLQRVGIESLGKRRLDTLSGGQQQRALLAKTLISPSKIILLDEPCSALDPVAREEFLLIVRQLADLGLTLFVSSHDWGKSLNVYDKVIALNQSILASGTPHVVQDKLDSINCMNNFCCA